MKHIIRLIAVLTLLIPVAGCRSSKQPKAEQEEQTAWSNVSMPVKIRIIQPQKFTFSGNATMVRGEYMLITMRFLGFEVGQAYLTPDMVDVVLRQPSKIWLREPVGKRLQRIDTDFVTLQETFLGNRRLLSKVPESINLTVAGTELHPAVTVKTELKGKPVEVELTWDLEQAKWNQTNPPIFKTPGSDYRQTDAVTLMKLIGGKAN